MGRVHRAQTAPPTTHPLSNELDPAFRADPDTLPQKANIVEGAATKQELANDRGWQAFRDAQPKRVTSSNTQSRRGGNGGNGGSIAVRERRILPKELEVSSPRPITPLQDVGLVSSRANAIPPGQDLGLTTPRRTNSWAKETVQSRSLTGMLLILSLSTANLDVVSFQRYGVFTTAQTGNTILLAYHAVERSQGNELRCAGVSLAFYFLSCVVFGQIGWRLGHRTRWWMFTSLIWQILLLLVIVVLVSPAGPPATSSVGNLDWVAVMLAALQGGPQLVMAGAAGVPEIPTAILTGTYASFAREEDLFHLHPRYRDLKLWYILAFWIGCFIGAIVARYSHTWVGFLVAMIGKILALAWVMLAKGDPKVSPVEKGPTG